MAGVGETTPRAWEGVSAWERACLLGRLGVEGDAEKTRERPPEVAAGAGASAERQLEGE